MLSRNELVDAIEELETAPLTFQNCQKLATFYSLYDHLYGVRPEPVAETICQSVIGEYGDSDFLQSVSGLPADKVFPLLDELMESVRLLQPRLYDATLTELKDM